MKTNTNKRKKRRLKKGVKKVLLYLLFIIIDVIIYLLCGKFGYLATENNFFSSLLVSGWAWLFFGKFFYITLIEEL